MNNMDVIDYRKFLNQAKLDLVKTILAKIKTEGLSEDHSLYLSFKTDIHGVVLSKKTKENYPREITIILQYQFDDLKIGSDGFSVSISFEGVKETIYVPFASLTAAIDPNGGFSLKLNPEIAKLNNFIDKIDKGLDISKSNKNSKIKSSNNVVSLDNFRNKTKD